MPLVRARADQIRWAEPADGFELTGNLLAGMFRLAATDSGYVGTFEALERLSTYASRAHALDCCPCGADHSADLLAHKLSLAAAVTADTRWFADSPERASVGSPQSATLIPSGDVGSTAGSATFISLGDTVFSQIETSGDQDWFGVTLQAGITYEFTLSGTGGSALSDPFLELMNSGGTQVAENDDGGPGLNSLLRYTPTTTGTYYLNAHDFSAGTGAYTLTAIESPPLPAYTIGQIADYLVNEGSSGGRSWGPDALTYNIEALTAEQRVLAERALQIWSAVTPLTFTRVTSGGNITFTNVDPTPGDPAAYAQNTFSGSTITSSTIVITSDWQGGETAYDSYTQQTYIHEVGHALGLGHAGPYNDSADFGTDNIYTNDNWAYTVMSYFDQAESNHGSYRFVLGLQQADIAAIQQLYGARASGTFAGNTTFGFNSSAPGTNIDWSQFVLVQAEGTYRRPPSMTIYDASGIDTINLSGFSQPQILDLRPGTFSSLGDRPSSSQPNYANVVSIEASTIIENAIGGAGNDRVTGNSANNTVTLGAGSDTFVYAPGGGADTITDFAVTVDKLDLTAFSYRDALAAFEGRTAYGDATLLTFSAGQTILLFAVTPGQIFRSDLILADGPEQVVTASPDPPPAQGEMAPDRRFGILDSATFSPEDQSLLRFRPLDYIASHGDLIGAFGLNGSAARSHYIEHGLEEGRSADNFDGLRYLASNTDLLLAYGVNETAAARHYILYGFAEARPLTAFNPAAYIAHYADLQAAFGSDLLAATAHYIRMGYLEGRSFTPSAETKDTDKPGVFELVLASGPDQFDFSGLVWGTAAESGRTAAFDWSIEPTVAPFMAELTNWDQAAFDFTSLWDMDPAPPHTWDLA